MITRTDTAVPRAAHYRVGLAWWSTTEYPGFRAVESTTNSAVDFLGIDRAKLGLPCLQTRFLCLRWPRLVKILARNLTRRNE